MKKIALIDGYGFVFRAYHSLPSLSRDDGTPVGAVFGFTNMLLKLIASLDISHIAVVFDSGSKTFRNDLYPEYKANRPPCPEDLIPQFSIIRECVEALNITTLEKTGFEADDIIATIAKKSSIDDYAVLIVSSDKDLMQLVNDNVSMYDAMKNKLINAQEVYEKFAVNPSQVIDALSLIGDSSDNVPGVKGIGPKTASELIQQFGTLENLYDNLELIPQEKRRATLLEYKENAFLSKKLIRLDDQVPLNITLDDLKARELDPHKLINFLERQGFRSLVSKVKKEFAIHNQTHHSAENNKTEDLNDLTKNTQKSELNNASDNNIQSSQSPKSNNPTIINNIEIKDPAIIDKIYFDAQRAGKIFINYAIIDGSIAFINLSCPSSYQGATNTYDVYYYDFINDDHSASQTSNIDNNIDLFNFQELHNPSISSNSKHIVFNDFAKIILDDSIKKIFYDAKNFLKYCLNDFAKNNSHSKLSNYQLPDICFDDIHLQSHLVNSATKHSLRELIDANLDLNFEELGYGEKLAILEDNLFNKNFTQQYLKIFSDSKHQIDFYGLINFACSQLYEIFNDKISQLRLHNCYKKIELPLIQVLAQIENNGIKIDILKLQQLSTDFANKISIIQQQIYAISGQEFNIASSKQLSEVLFSKLGIQSTKKSKKTRELSTNAKVLEDLAIQGHEIANKIIEFRKFMKLKNTYCDTLPEQINPRTQRIHTTLSNTATLTGRLNSVNPNLQNIPIKSAEGKKIRECFIASFDNQIVSADYSQIELRILAHLSQSSQLIQAFKDDQDIHKITASEIFDLPLEEINDTMRSRAKTINFGIIYGISAFGLARQLKISNSEANQYIKAYFEKYLGIKEFMHHNIETAKSQGYVETISGRKCFIHDINHRNPIIRQEAERQAINAPIQGSSADIIKKAMIKIHQRFYEMKLNSKLILQIHDELLIEAIPSEINIVKDIVEYEMANSYKISVDLKVDFSTRNHW